MKTLLLTTLFLLMCMNIKAQENQAYIKAMTQGLETLDNAKNKADYQDAAGQFERIAAVAKSEWHPFYYAALSNINMTSRVETLKEKDQLTDKAQTFIEAALTMAPNNAEVIALQGYKYMVELSADAGNRGQSLSAKAMMYFGKSLALDPKNPRANFFMAQMQYGMAQFFGSSTEKPCQQANMAVKLFKEQPEEQSFDPKWGQAGAENFIKQCNN